MTHAELVALAAKWLKTHRSCKVVGTEFNVQGCYESPDAIGWTYTGKCVVVEAKTSRSDFKADQKKLHKQTGCQLGSERWYIAPEGLIRVSELPDGYGLIEVTAKGKLNCYRKDGSHWVRGDFLMPITEGRNHQGEISILVSVLRLQHRDDYRSKRNLFIDEINVENP